MTKELSDRRANENEKLAQEDNESIAKAAKAVYGDSTEIHFYCECSTRRCSQRIDLTVKDYRELHRGSDMYIVTPSHEDTSIEDIISKQPEYYVVEKR